MTSTIPIYVNVPILTTPEINIWQQVIDLSLANSDILAFELVLTNGVYPQVGSTRITVKYAFSSTAIPNYPDRLPHIGIIEAHIPNIVGGIVVRTTDAITIRAQYLHVWIEHEKLLGLGGATISLNAVITANTALRNVVGNVELENFLGTGTSPTHTRAALFTATDSTGAMLKTWNINLVNGYGPYFNYLLTDVPALTGGISVKTAWNLRRRQIIYPNLGTNVLNFTGNYKLLGGDITGNNSVGQDDLDAMATQWYNNSTVQDINGDGIVNGTPDPSWTPGDLNSIAGTDYWYIDHNWNKSGDSETPLHTLGEGGETMLGEGGEKVITEY